MKVYYQEFSPAPLDAHYVLRVRYGGTPSELNRTPKKTYLVEVFDQRNPDPVTGQPKLAASTTCQYPYKVLREIGAVFKVAGDTDPGALHGVDISVAVVNEVSQIPPTTWLERLDATLARRIAAVSASASPAELESLKFWRKTLAPAWLREEVLELLRPFRPVVLKPPEASSGDMPLAELSASLQRPAQAGVPQRSTAVDKQPAPQPTTLAEKRAALASALKLAVSHEDYEVAAKLRDELAKLPVRYNKPDLGP